MTSRTAGATGGKLQTTKGTWPVGLWSVLLFSAGTCAAPCSHDFSIKCIKSREPSLIHGKLETTYIESGQAAGKRGGTENKPF